MTWRNDPHTGRDCQRCRIDIMLYGNTYWDLETKMHYSVHRMVIGHDGRTFTMTISQELEQLRIHLEGLRGPVISDEYEQYYVVWTGMDCLHQQAIIEDCLRMVNTWL